MDLVINDKIITEPIENIIYELKREANWDVFHDIQNKGTYLRVTCPIHSDGHEHNPSCSIFIDYNSSDILPGTFHCFSCGAKGTLVQLISIVLGINEFDAKHWLIEKYGNIIYSNDTSFPEWEQNKAKPVYLDESILSQYSYYHPYLQKRKISFDIAKKFSVGFNALKNTVTFPVWDINDHLVMITERSINTKQFYIPAGVDKPLYLLNFIMTDLYNGKKYPYVMITEGQIDALTAWTYGMPCIATCGSLSHKQIDILNKSGIKSFITMFDNDKAGKKFTSMFNKEIDKKCWITNIDINIPNKKDINDLSKDEFDFLLKSNGILV